MIIFQEVIGWTLRKAISLTQEDFVDEVSEAQINESQNYAYGNGNHQHQTCEIGNLSPGQPGYLL